MTETRAGALARAHALFDSGAFRARLERLVAIPSTAQEEKHRPDLDRYLAQEIVPWLDRLGFEVGVYDNPEPDFGPILVARRHEGDHLPTVLGYGHGDTVRGLDEQWSDGLKPWEVTVRGERWYGRGTADNKGQHAINLAALEAVMAERGGRLGFNYTFLLEMTEERGSRGLKEFIAANTGLLAADVLIASDGPRHAPPVPNLTLGSRGGYHFELVVDLRPGGVHSGHWGGLIPDPATILSHALATIVSPTGQILVRDWVPQSIPNSVRAALAGCELEGGPGAPEIPPGWGEPGLSAAEKVFAWTGFIVLSMLVGKPDFPVNAVAPRAIAHCQIRHTVDIDPKGIVPALRRHLDERGFGMVEVRDLPQRSRPASRTDPDNPWVGWAHASMERTAGRKVQIIPNLSGGLPSDLFLDILGTPTLWVPHSYNGCKQHGPDEHLLAPLVREGLALMAGLWWDLGEPGTPAPKAKPKPKG